MSFVNDLSEVAKEYGLELTSRPNKQLLINIMSYLSNGMKKSI